MKKLLALLLALMMLFSVATLFAGCDDSGKKKNSSSKRDDDEDDDEDDEDDGDDGSSDPSGSEPTTDEPTTGGEPTTGEPTAGGNPTTPPATEQKDVLLSLQESMDAYVEVITGKGTSKLERLAPNAYWGANGYTMSEIRATFPDAYADYADGETIEARCTLISYELLDATKTAQIAENLEEVGLDADKVEAAATAVGNVYSSNGVESVENEQTIYGVCYDGQWYAMINERTLFGDFIIYLMDSYSEGKENPDISLDEDVTLKQFQECMDIYLEVGTGTSLARLERLAPAVFWENCGYSLDDIYKTFPDAYAYYTDGEAMESYCTVTSYELLGADELDEMMNNLSDTGMVAGKADACALVHSYVIDIIDGEKDQHEQDFYAVRYDGVWYAMITESTLFADFVVHVMDYYSYSG